LQGQGHGDELRSKVGIRKEAVALEDAGEVCTVRDAEHSRKVVVSAADPPRPKEMPNANDNSGSVGGMGLHMDVEVPASHRG